MSLPAEMVQLGRGSRTLCGSHLSAPPNPPSHRLVMRRDSQRTHARVSGVVECMLEPESTDALDKGKQNAV